jgi:isopentenyldiphosphate isomerase
MTQLAEKFQVTVTLNHDEVNSSVYMGETNLHQRVREVWETIPPWFTIDVRAFPVTFHWPGIEIVLSRTGLEEIPETGGGDN